MPTRRSLVVALVVLVAHAGCALGGGTLGGRSTCWPEAEQRAPSLWRGILRIDATGGRLDTPEGDVIPLLPGELEIRIGENGIGELGQGGDVVARDGDAVSLFGGAGADGALVVCAVEEMP